MSLGGGGGYYEGVEKKRECERKIKKEKMN
jgi:hypothetical protein